MEISAVSYRYLSPIHLVPPKSVDELILVTGVLASYSSRRLNSEPMAAVGKSVIKPPEVSTVVNVPVASQMITSALAVIEVHTISTRQEKGVLIMHFLPVD
jgi:hypothetical protein